MFKYNIKPIVSILIGSPLESKETLEQILKDIQKIKKIHPNAQFELSPLTLEIGTKLWDDYKSKKVELFKSKTIHITSQYAGTQPFSEKYFDVTLTPQNFLFKNNNHSNENFEKLLLSFIQKYEKLIKI